MRRGKTSSPEEYRGDRVTHMIGVYGIGNVLYSILTGEYPFYEHSSSTVKKLVGEGHHGNIYQGTIVLVMIPWS